MPKQVRLPDGQIGFFGDMESPAEIRAKIEKKYPDAYKSQTALAARGAARGFAGNAADAMRLSHLPGIGGAVGAMFPPAAAWNMATKLPGDPLRAAAAEKATTEFADAETPSGAEYLGWAGSQIVPAFLAPEIGLAKSLGNLAKSGLKKGGQYALEKSGLKGAEKGAAKVAGEGAGIGPKPKLRMKADGSIVEVTPEGGEKTVTNWTRRQMEKRELTAKGQPTSSTAYKPGEQVIGGSPDADHAAVIEALSNHQNWAHAKHVAKMMGVPTWLALGILTRGGRNVAGRGIKAGVATEGRALSGENPPYEQGQGPRPSGPSQTNPPTLPQNGGGPR